VANPEILIGRTAKRNLSALSYFVANAHNEPYAFYTGLTDLLTKAVDLLEKKIYAAANKGRPAPPFPYPLWIRHWSRVNKICVWIKHLPLSNYGTCSEAYHVADTPTALTTDQKSYEWLCYTAASTAEFVPHIEHRDPGRKSSCTAAVRPLGVRMQPSIIH